MFRVISLVWAWRKPMLYYSSNILSEVKTGWRKLQRLGRVTENCRMGTVLVPEHENLTWGKYRVLAAVYVAHQNLSFSSINRRVSGWLKREEGLEPIHVVQIPGPAALKQPPSTWRAIQDIHWHDRIVERHQSGGGDQAYVIAKAMWSEGCFKLWRVLGITVAETASDICHHIDQNQDIQPSEC